MLSWIALACLIGAILLLIALSVIDIKTRLLPNEMVAGFATLGFVFHLTTLAAFSTVPEIFLGGFIGFAAMYLIRYIANRFYEQDALGLGDVKLIGAGGIWLGPDSIMLAMALGAVAAMIHGFIYGLWDAKKNNTKLDLARLQIPAGPGFAVGIILVALLEFQGFRVSL
jgi:leader peptidase (prepilin peptidase) / N-methyltransferase